MLHYAPVTSTGSNLSYERTLSAKFSKEAGGPRPTGFQYHHLSNTRNGGKAHQGQETLRTRSRVPVPRLVRVPQRAPGCREFMGPPPRRLSLRPGHHIPTHSPRFSTRYPHSLLPGCEKLRGACQQKPGCNLPARRKTSSNGGNGALLPRQRHNARGDGWAERKKLVSPPCSISASQTN